MVINSASFNSTIAFDCMAATAVGALKHSLKHSLQVKFAQHVDQSTRTQRFEIAFDIYNLSVCALFSALICV